MLAKRQVQATAPEPKPAPSQAPTAAVRADTEPHILESAADTSQQISVKLREVEEQLRQKQARADALANRVAELDKELGRATASEALLSAERQRATDLEAKIVGLEQQAVQVPQLAAALKVQQETFAKVTHDAVAWQQTFVKVTGLEATVLKDREAAEQVVEQLAEITKVAAHAKEVEAKLAIEGQRMLESQQKAKDLGAALAAERSRVEELNSKIAPVEPIAMKVHELKRLLAR